MKRSKTRTPKRSQASKSKALRSKASRSKSPPRSVTRAVPAMPPPSKLTAKKVGLNKAPAALDTKQANTVVYVHGIDNKPPADVLKCQWDRALFDIEQGDRSRMAYWVDRTRYPTPLNETCAAGDKVRVADTETSLHSIQALTMGRPHAADRPIEQEVTALTDDPIRQAWLKRVSDKLIAGTELSQGEVRTRSVRAKVLPFPDPFRRIIAEALTRAFLRDVNDFLFDAQRRDAMEQPLLDRLSAGGGPFVVVAHSQGSMIAYDVLRRLDPKQFEVPLFITIGSPLGLQEVQDALRQWTGNRLPFPPCVKHWINVADRLDPVAFDNDISNDFGHRAEQRQPPPSSFRHRIPEHQGGSESGPRHGRPGLRAGDRSVRDRQGSGR
jgi:hypothetical protein